MCLRINNAVKLPKTDKDGYCKGYKAISSDQSPNLSLFAGLSLDWMNRYKYFKGINQSSRLNKKLNDTEIFRGWVDHGFNLFLNKKDSLLFKNKVLFKNKDYPIKIIVAYFKPEDVVTTGTWPCGTKNYDNVVVTKMLIKSLKGIK